MFNKIFKRRPSHQEEVDLHRNKIGIAYPSITTGSSTSRQESSKHYESNPTGDISTVEANQHQVFSISSQNFDVKDAEVQHKFNQNTSDRQHPNSALQESESADHQRSKSQDELLPPQYDDRFAQILRDHNLNRNGRRSSQPNFKQKESNNNNHNNRGNARRTSEGILKPSQSTKDVSDGLENKASKHLSFLHNFKRNNRRSSQDSIDAKHEAVAKFESNRRQYFDRKTLSEANLNAENNNAAIKPTNCSNNNIVKLNDSNEMSQIDRIRQVQLYPNADTSREVNSVIKSAVSTPKKKKVPTATLR